MKTWQEEKGWPKTKLTQEMIGDWAPFVEQVEKHMRDEIEKNQETPGRWWGIRFPDGTWMHGPDGVVHYPSKEIADVDVARHRDLARRSDFWRQYEGVYADVFERDEE